MNKRIWTLCLLMMPFWLGAQEAGDTRFKGFDKAVPTKANKQLQAFVYFYQQNVAMNMALKTTFSRVRLWAGCLVPIQQLPPINLQPSMPSSGPFPFHLLPFHL